MEKRAVLFVDDETVMLDLARDIFSKRKGYECFLADNAADALEVLRTEQIDVVVGDIYLRGVSGLELLAKIQKNHLDVGVIMVTGEANLESAQQAMRLGALDYIIKPFHVSPFLEAVENVYQKVMENRRWQAEKLESEKRYELLLKSVKDVIWETDLKLNYKFFSPSVEQVFGWTPEEALQLTLLDFMDQPDLERLLSLFNHELAAEMSGQRDWDRSQSVEIYEKTKSGERIWVEITIRFLRDKTGKPIGLVGVSRDISNRKKAEQELAESLAKLRAMHEATDMPSYIADPEEHVIMQANPAFLQIFGNTAVGGKCCEILGEFGLACPGCENSSFKKVSPMQLQGKGATNKWYRAESHMIAWPDGKEKRYVKFVDVTLDRQAAAENALFSEFSTEFNNLPIKRVGEGVDNMLKTLADYFSADRAYVFDAREQDGSFFVSNTHEYCRAGIAPQINNLQMLSVDIIPWWWDQLERFKPIILDEMDDLPEEARGEKKILQEQSIQSLLAVPMIREGVTIGFLGLDCVRKSRVWTEKDYELMKRISDLTVNVIGRQKAVNALRRSEKRHRKMIEQLSVGVLLCDDNGLIIECNPQVGKFTGYKTGEILGRNLLTFFELDYKIKESLLRSPGAGYEFFMKRKDGGQVTLKINMDLFEKSHGDKKIIQATLRDVSEKTIFAEEKAILREQLNQAQKMEAVGRLAGGMAHDSNNNLTVITANVEVMRLFSSDLSDDARECLAEIEKATRRAAELNKQLLAFSRKQPIRMLDTDLSGLVENNVKIMIRTIGEDLQLSWQAVNDLWRVRVDPTQVEQVLLNLVINARDAIESRQSEEQLEGKVNDGKIEINLVNKVVQIALPAAGGGKILPGEYVVLEVADNGTGIDEEHLKRVFEPFFTTKAQGKGTGLGLSTAFGIISQMEGYFRISSGKNGAKFKIYLPRRESVSDQARQMREAEQKHLDGKERILMAEDEISVLNVAQKLLEHSGFAVEAFSEPLRIARMSEKDLSQFHLLLTDVKMPGLNGKELAEKVKEKNPAIKVVFMSGYNEEVVSDHGIIPEDAHFISKPFKGEELISLLRKALDD